MWFCFQILFHLQKGQCESEVHQTAVLSWWSDHTSCCNIGSGWSGLPVIVSRSDALNLKPPLPFLMMMCVFLSEVIRIIRVSVIKVKIQIRCVCIKNRNYPLNVLISHKRNNQKRFNTGFERVWIRCTDSDWMKCCWTPSCAGYASVESFGVFLETWRLFFDWRKCFCWGFAYFIC